MKSKFNSSLENWADKAFDVWKNFFDRNAPALWGFLIVLTIIYILSLWQNLQD